jgi:DNA repair protein RadC
MRLDVPLCGLWQAGEVLEMNRIPKYRIALVREKSIPWQARIFSGSQSVWKFGKQLTEDADREQFWALMLDSKNKLIGINLVSQGSLSSSIVHPREVLKPAILLSAAAIVVLHNHPSGDPVPSDEDRACTTRLTEACNVVGIRLLDHIIIVGESDFFSFSDSQGRTLC